MNKRNFLAIQTAAAAACLVSGIRGVNAQGKLQPGKHYRRVSPAQRTQAPEGKIEVIEFLWVGCPHCRRLEPVLQQWESKIPNDVFFRRVHVNFRTPSHQQLFYTLVSLSKEAALIETVFHEIHDKRNRLNTADKVFDWAQDQGLDRNEFIRTYKSFGVKTAMRQASQEVKSFGLTSVPALAVNGKYVTSPSMAGSNRAALSVVDQLIEIERQSG